MSGSTRDEIIATEQKAVNHAYDCYAARLAEMTGTSAASASASGKDSVAIRQHAEARAASYGGLGEEALVFSRVDASEDPGGEPRPWYIGRRVVRDAMNELVVLQWTSPLAKTWTDARPDAPGDVVLRRRLRCRERVVEDFHDEISPAPATRAGAPTAPETETTADDTTALDGSPAQSAPAAPPPEAAQVPEPQEGPRGRSPGEATRRRRPTAPQPDDFLLRELQRSRSARMRDIVETIRRDQMELVADSPSDILVIQGGPGTGKSAVGLHRVTWLVDNDHFKAQDILVIGPHQRFLDYVGRVLPTLGTRDVNSVQLTRLWDGEALGTDTAPGRLVKSDERMTAVLTRRVESDCRPEVLDDLVAAPSFEGDEPAVVVTAGSTTLRVARSEVLALLEEARTGDGAYRERRERFRNLLVDRLLQELASVAPRRGRGDTIRRDLERNRRVERLVDRVWPSPSAREALRSLYDSPDLLRACADGVLDEDEQAALHRPRAATADADAWTLDDHVCLEELRFLISGESPRRYGHIVIDEAQDLTPMQARALHRRCAANGSMTVLGDLAQATGPHSHPDWEHLGALLSDHGDWHVAELHTSYRVPTEIMQFVAPLARAVAPALPYPRAVRSAGEDSVRVVATEPWSLVADTVAQATRLVGTSDGASLRSVAVIVPDDSRWLEEITRRLDVHEHLDAERRETVAVLSAAQAKGLEYDHVLVVEPATIADRGPAGLRQLYIALTRSTQTLTVLHTSPLPAALTPADTGGTPDTRAAAPDKATEAVPDVGSDIRVKVVGRGPGGRYKVKALSPGTGRRPLVLTVRHGSTPPHPGQELDCWVFANETNQSVLTTDARGRKPVSARMAERYVAALGVLDDLVTAGAAVPEDARSRLAELQGMANRVLRRDQADWVEVRRLLGAPERDRLSVLRDLAARTNRTLKNGTFDPGLLRDELAESGWAGPLSAARETLRARTVDGTDSASAARPDPQTEQKEPETVVSAPELRTDSSPTSANITAQPEFLCLLETAASTDRACSKHEAVRHALKSALLWRDLQPGDSPIVDVSCVTEDGLFIYEVLGAGHASYPELRAGAARLLEIHHTLPTTADRLWLVLAEAPAEEWAAETVRAAFGVHVLWRTPDNWGGRETDVALGRGRG